MICDRDDGDFMTESREDARHGIVVCADAAAKLRGKLVADKNNFHACPPMLPFAPSSVAALLPV